VAAPSPETAVAGPDVATPDNSRIPFRGPFFQLCAERKSKGQDIKLAVASANAETGVGKSTCAYYLAHLLDTSPDGFDTEQKATLNVGDYLGAYQELPLGSAVILDEAEQLTKRRATSKKNVKTSERLQMNRVKEISALFTLPKFDVLDPLVQDLLDFRVEIERLGRATIYRKTHDPFSGTWWQEVQSFDFPAMDDCPGMQQFHALKDDYLEEDNQNLVKESEVEGRVNEELKERLKERRNDRIAEWNKDATLTQRDIAEEKLPEWAERAVPDKLNADEFVVTQSTVNKIVNSR
jgi:hypothetical protein